MIRIYECDFCNNLATINRDGYWRCKSCERAWYKHYKLFEQSTYKYRILVYFIRSVFRTEYV